MSADYRGSHQPFEDGATLADLTPMWGPDVYPHPEWYTFGLDEEWGREAVAVTLAVRGKPDAPVTIYRAVPPGVTEIRTGDWVGISRGYVARHAMQNDDPADDWPILSAPARAGDVRTGGSDLNEWGYFGPTVTGELST